MQELSFSMPPFECDHIHASSNDGCNVTVSNLYSSCWPTPFTPHRDALDGNPNLQQDQPTEQVDEEFQGGTVILILGAVMISIYSFFKFIKVKIEKI